MIGSTIDKYEVLEKVGEGGMATVYLGRHNTLKRIVAIKVLHPHLSASIRNRQRFAREARAIEHLDHDNILQIFDYSGLDAEDCFIVTEFDCANQRQPQRGPHRDKRPRRSKGPAQPSPKTVAYTHVNGAVKSRLSTRSRMPP